MSETNHDVASGSPKARSRSSSPGNVTVQNCTNCAITFTVNNDTRPAFQPPPGLFPDEEAVEIAKRTMTSHTPEVPSTDAASSPRDTSSSYKPDDILREKVRGLRQAEAEWADLPAKLQIIMASTFFRLHYRWRFLRDEEALAELKRQAEVDPIVRDNYQRIDFWPYIFSTCKGMEGVQKALGYWEKLERAKAAMPEGFFAGPANDWVPFTDKTIDEIIEEEWVDLGDRKLFEGVSKDSIPENGRSVKDAEKDRIAREKAMKKWRAEQERSLLADKKKMEADNKKAKEIHNEWMAEQWRETLGYETPKRKGKKSKD